MNRKLLLINCKGRMEKKILLASREKIILVSAQAKQKEVGKENQV